MSHPRPLSLVALLLVGAPALAQQPPPPAQQPVDPVDADTHYRNGVAFKKQGKIPDATREFEAAVQGKGDDPAYRFSLGVIYRMQNRPGDAVIHLEKAVELQPQSAEYNRSLGVTYHRLGRADDALRVLEKACQLDPNDVVAHQSAGAIFRQKKDYAKALLYLEKAVTLAPDNAEALSNYAVAARHSGEPAKAEKILKHAIELKPQSADLRFNLCVAYRAQKKLDLAIAECEKAVALDPKQPLALHDLGLFYEVTGKKPQAIEAWNRYLVLINLDNPAEAEVVRIHVKALGGVPGAAAVVVDTEASELATASPQEKMKYHYFKGTKKFELAKYDEAIKEFEQAYKNKTDPALMYNIAQAHRLAGHRPDALRYYKLYLELDAESPIRATIEQRIRELESSAAAPEPAARPGKKR